MIRARLLLAHYLTIRGPLWAEYLTGRDVLHIRALSWSTSYALAHRVGAYFGHFHGMRHPPVEDHTDRTSESSSVSSYVPAAWYDL